MNDGADHIVERNPAPVLSPCSDPASPAELEDGQRTPKRPTFGTEHDAEPRVHHPHPGLTRRLGRSLPLLAHPGQEHGARLALLGKQLVAPVSVVPDRRGRDHHGWRLREPCDLLGQQMCPLLPALQDAPLPLRRPASLGDARSREVDYGVKTCQISFDRARIRVPADVFARTWRARKAVDPVPSRLQLRDQSRPDKSLRPAHENVHAPPPYASVASTHMVTTATPQNRMNSPTYSYALPSQQPRNADTPQSIAFGDRGGSIYASGPVRPLLDDRIYLTDPPLFVLPSMRMVCGCLIDVRGMRRRHE